MTRSILLSVLIACTAGLPQSGPVLPTGREPEAAGRPPCPVLRESSSVCRWVAAGTRIVDTGEVTAFDIASDRDGRLWAAVSYPGGDLRLLTSENDGRDWRRRFLLQPGSPVHRVKLVPAQGESSFVFLFFLERAGDGDLWLLRVADDTTAMVMPVRVGPDTVDDFSATCDRDSQYYLYCLYANERRTGRTGAFIRSVDFGRNWNSAADWWNGWDPHLSYTAGSTIHCAWRYALTGSEIHYSFNRHYGASGYWSWQRTVSSGRKCWDPVVAQADTTTDWQAPVWVFYTVGRRDTSHRDVAYAYSLNNGADWSTGHSFSDPYVDEWSGDILFDAGRPGGFLAYCYNQRGIRQGDATAVNLCLGSAGDSTYWTRPIPVNPAPACARADGTGPRLVYTSSEPARVPAVAWCGQDENGLYITAPWLDQPEPRDMTESPDDCNRVPSLSLLLRPNPARSMVDLNFDVPAAGKYRLTVYDAGARVVEKLTAAATAPGTLSCRWRCGNSPAGTYFLELVGPGIKARTRLTLLGPAANQPQIRY